VPNPKPTRRLPARRDRRAERDVLTRAFEAVRSTFFPRWDTTRLWKCRVKRQWAGDGLCVHEKKTIHVNPSAKEQIGILIHEICHALAPRLNHGGRWQRRMRTAAKRAEELGEPSLQRFLELEIAEYRNSSEKVTPRSIYCEIEQAIDESIVIPRFESMIRVLAQKNLMPTKKFLHAFRGSKKAYRRAVALRRLGVAASCSDRVWTGIQHRSHVAEADGLHP
jgi:hypothetical protein